MTRPPHAWVEPTKWPPSLRAAKLRADRLPSARHLAPDTRPGRRSVASPSLPLQAREHAYCTIGDIFFLPHHFPLKRMRQHVPVSASFRRGGVSSKYRRCITHTGLHRMRWNYDFVKLKTGEKMTNWPGELSAVSTEQFPARAKAHGGSLVRFDGWLLSSTP